MLTVNFTTKKHTPFTRYRAIYPMVVCEIPLHSSALSCGHLDTFLAVLGMTKSVDDKYIKV